MWEDYKTPAFQIHESALFVVGLFTVYLAVPLALLLLCFRRFRGSRKLHLHQAVIYALGWAFILFLIEADPTSFTAWFLD